MADSSIIGALRVVLGTDTAAWEDGLNKAQASMQGMITKATAMGTAIGNIVTEMVEKGFDLLKEAVVSSAERIQEFNNHAESLGTTVEAFSTLAYAAQQADFSSDELAKGMGKMEVALDKARSGTGAAAEAMQRLGISQGELASLARNPEEAMKRLADGFSGIQDPAERARLASDVFGRGVGVDMLRLLQDGSGGITEMQARARELGIEISGPTAAAAKEFDDKLKDLKAAGTALEQQLAAALLPVITQGIAAFQRMTQGIQVSDGAMQLFQATIRAVIAVLITAAGVAQAVASVFNTTASISMRLLSGDWAGAVKAADDGMGSLKKIAGDTITSLHDLYTASAEPPANAKNKGFNADDDESSPPVKHMKKIKQHADEAAKALKALQSDWDQVWASMETPVEKATDEFAKRMDITKKALAAGIIDLDQYKEAAARASEALLAVTNPIQKMKAPDTGGLKNVALEMQDNLSKAIDSERDHFADTFGKSFADGIQSILDGDFGDWLKNFWHNTLNSALQGLGENLGKMLFNSLNVGASALGSGGGGGGGGLLGSLLGDAGKLFGFATGGSFNVGGSGGTDSQLVAFRASPNETVSITRPEDAGPSGGSVTQHFHVNAQGAILASGLISEMQQMGIKAANAGSRMGQARVNDSLARRNDRRLGQSA